MFSDDISAKVWFIIIAFVLVIVFFIALFYFAPKGTDTATALANDICKELSGDPTSQFVLWGGVGSCVNCPEGIHWSITCTTGLESIRGTY